MEKSEFESERFERQGSLVPRKEILGVGCTVVGVGAVGRQVALQLSAIGAPYICLIDHDSVEVANLSTQGFNYEDLGLSKVTAVSRSIAAMHGPETQPRVGTVFSKFSAEDIPNKGSQISAEGQPLRNAVFCCVDGIATRESLWAIARPRMDFWADSRLWGETLRILTATGDDRESRDAYASKFFSPEESALAVSGRCTTPNTIYTSTIAAALLVHQFTRWLRGIPTDRDMLVNLLSSEIRMMEEETASA